MRKIRNIIFDIIKFLLYAAFFYFLFTSPGYTILSIFGIIAFYVLNAFYVVYRIQKLSNDMLKNIENDYTTAARLIFKYNLIARKIFEIVIKNHKKKNSEKEVDKSCLTILKLSIGYTNDDVKKAWKEQAKLYHPDKYQNDIDKKEASDKFKLITECKDKLLRN